MGIRKYWPNAFVSGNAKSICLDGDFTLSDLKKLVSELEAGTEIEWLGHDDPGSIPVIENESS